MLINFSPLVSLSRKEVANLAYADYNAVAAVLLPQKRMTWEFDVRVVLFIRGDIRPNGPGRG